MKKSKNTRTAQRLTPRLEIYPARIQQNTRQILKLCLDHGVGLSCVTKVTSAHPAVVGALVKAGAKVLADSRTENLRAIRKQGYKGRLLLTRLPTPSRATEVVETADLSLVSNLESLRALAQAARAARKTHQTILMVDLGDLREGVWEEHALDLIRKIYQERAKLKGVELLGLGTNLACFGGVIPTPQSLGRLVALTEMARRETGWELPIVSGGNSSSLPLLTAGLMPAGVNHLRVGETILLGRNVMDRSPFPGMRQDTFVAVGEIIELERKPSMPVGARGQDAFGKVEEFKDRGTRLRAIVNLGRQDAVLTGLTPLVPGIEVLGGSSDHLILDVEGYEGSLHVGSELKFMPDYGALLALSTSPYVQKQVILR